MKVDGTDAHVNARLASWMGFLRAAKKVTLQRLAQDHGTQRSNLSAYVTSGGKTRNISMDKILGVLFDLGALSDGVLRPGLHRWTITEDMVAELCEMVASNGFEKAFIFVLGSGYGAFLVAQVASNILIFVKLPAESISAVSEGLKQMSEKMKVITLDRAGDSQIQALWMTQDDAVVQSSLETLIG